MIQTLDYRNTTVGKLEPKLQKAFNFLNEKSQNCRSNFYEAKIEWEEGQFRGAIKRANDPEDTFPDYLAKSYEIKLERLGMFKLQWLQEAQLNFDGKLLKMAAKLVEFGMMDEGVVLDTEDLEIDEYMGMEFYVGAIQKEGWNRMGRAHARFVWVDCYEKESHYRFIVTYKKDKNFKEEVKEEVKEVEVTNEPSIDYKGSRKEQVAFLMNYGKNASFIANELGANVSYVRKLMRDIKNK